MAETHVFPQSGDADFADNFGQLIGHSNVTEFVERGMGFTPDYTVPDVDIGTGLAYISIPSRTFTDNNSNTVERFDVGFAIQLSSATVSLTDGDVNHIYVEPNIGTDDNASYAAYTNESNAGSNALKIGEVDTSNDTSTELNREPDIVVHDIDLQGQISNFSISGDLTLDSDLLATDGEVIWDESNTHIPTARLQDSDITVNGSDGLSGGTASLGGSLTIGISGDLDLDSDLLAAGGEVIWDESNGYIPNARLESDSLTVSAGDGLTGGGSVALGGTTTLNVDLDIEDGGTDVTTAHGINFGSDLNVTDDGDGTVTVDSAAIGTPTATATALSSHQLNSGEYVALDRIPVPSGNDIDVYVVGIVNDSFNTPAGLNLIVRNASTGTNEATYNVGHEEGQPYATVTGVGGDNIILAADNGDLGSGTGSSQTVNARIKYDLV